LTAASRHDRIASLRVEIDALERLGAPRREALAFGDKRIDALLPGGGLALSCWHEFAGAGLDLETCAASAGLVARLVAPLADRGEMVWVLRRDDLHAPGLAGLGLPAERLIQVCARDEAEVMAVMEDALRTPGVAAVVGEADEADLVAGRRLQLACESGAATGFLLRRRPFGGSARARVSASAAATRWRVAPAPSAPTAADDPGLGPARWQLELERCRGGRTGAWIVEAWEEDDAAYPLRLVAELGDRDVATPLRLAG
jgi:protein ImuA